jgi:hypothetical protein
MKSSLSILHGCIIFTLIVFSLSSPETFIPRHIQDSIAEPNSPTSGGAIDSNNTTPNNTNNNTNDNPQPSGGGSTGSNSTFPSDLPPTNGTIPENKTEPFNPGFNITNNTVPIVEEPYVDTIKVDIYKSKLTKAMRDQYDYWIRYKNSFNTEEGQLAKMTKYFQPESETYYTTIYKSGWPFYALAALFAFLFISYLVLRFFFGKFTGPKSHITVWFGYFTWGLISKHILFIILIKLWDL